MNSVHPALSLLIGLCLILSVGMPVIAGLLLIGRRDRMASLWFSGLVCSALGAVALAVLRQSNGITVSAMTVALALMTAAVRMELPPYRPRWPWLGFGLAVYALLQLWLDLAGLRHSWGVALASITLTAQEAYAAYWVLRALRQYSSRGLVLVVLGLVLVMAGNVLRLGSLLQQQQAQAIFSFTLATNLTVISVTVTTVLLSFGYVLFMLEKTHLRHLAEMQAAVRAEERRQAAQEHAEQLQQVVEQRDAMILLNSRFSAVSNLALFNSAIVHEVSQPLQALRMLLEMIAISPDGDDAGRRERIGQAHQVLMGMADTLQSLRDLVQMQSPRLQALRVDEALLEIEPILQTQIRYRGAQLRFELGPGLEGVQVLAQRVMLQRIVFNLVANALEATSAQDPEVVTAEPMPPPARAGLVIGLSARLAEKAGQRLVLVRVEDNGPGLPAQVLEHADHLFFSTKPQGTGLGLALARVIAQSWRGDLRCHNRPLAEGGGACIELSLPA